MFAKQPSPLSKHQSELPPDRRPGSLGPATGSNGLGSTAQQSSTASLPLHPTLQNTASQVKSAAAEPPVETDPLATGSRLIVGPDVKLKGAEILDCDTLVVEGRVEATMDSRVIRITEHGAFHGKVGIDVAEIFGEFDGDLTARQQLIIHATGRVSGKIRYGKLLVEEGGTLSGDIQSINATPSHAQASLLGDFQSRTNSSSTFEKEANIQTKAHLSTVAG